MILVLIVVLIVELHLLQERSNDLLFYDPAQNLAVIASHALHSQKALFSCHASTLGLITHSREEPVALIGNGSAGSP